MRAALRSLELLPSDPGLRRFAAANLVNTVGSGLYLTGSALFFTRVIGLSSGQVALGLGTATAVGLALMVVCGKLADRVGAKPVYLGLLLLQAAAMTGYVFVDDFTGFMVVAVISGVADRGISGTVGALIHVVAPPAERLTARAQLRTATNVGLGCGTLLAGIALSLGTPTAYRTLILGNALLFLVAAALISRVPARAPLKRDGSGAETAAARAPRPLRDRGYLAVTAANGLLSLHVSTLSFALPLWVVTRTEAPAWSVSLLVLVNTVLVVLLQVRAGRSAATLPAAVRQTRRAGLLLALSCGLMFLTAHLPVTAVVPVLLLWAVVFTLGELAQSSSGFYFGFELAPDTAQGAYQSVFALGPGIMRSLAPGLLSLVVLDHGSAGWLWLGALFTVAGVLTAACARRAGLRLTTDPSTPVDPVDEVVPVGAPTATGSAT
ncbi:MFS transporter [Streptomyces sp. LMG1-1-1.1]|uniref:MFS transporter n=1 Tax=Streptomyces sp. LMG1-1-1.1 TaxID=3135245 RepID=UPI003466686E